MSRFKPPKDYSKLSHSQLETHSPLKLRGSDSVSSIATPLLAKKSQLTNANMHAMRKNHSLMRSQIMEQPHHYFPVNDHMIREAMLKQ